MENDRTLENCRTLCVYLQVQMESGKRILPYKIVKDDASVAVVGAIHELRHHVIFEGRISVGTDEQMHGDHQIRYRGRPPFVPVATTGELRQSLNTTVPFHEQLSPPLVQGSQGLA